MSGICFYEFGEYLAEKCYRLYNISDDKYITHMKGLNATFQKEYHESNIDRKKFPFLKNPEIRQNYEKRANLMKLMLNSFYGYSL